VKSTTDLLSRLGLAVASVAVGLLLCELGLRGQAWWQDSREREAFERLGESRQPAPGAEAGLRDIIRASRHRRIIYELRPNLSVTYAGVKLETNPEGFRGPGISVSKPPGTIRIVGLGDSVMFGSGVSYEDCYLTVLGEWLRAEHPDVRWQTINTAVPGYNTVIEVETLRVKALRYEPDIVIMGFVGNDLALPNFIRADQNHLSLRVSYLLDFLRHRRLKHVPTARRDGLMPAPPRLPDAEERDNAGPVPKEYAGFVGLAAYREAMEKLASLRARHGFDVVVVAQGARREVQAVRARLDIPIVTTSTRLMRYMREHGIDRYAGSALTVSEHDVHPSPLGHRIIADVLFEHITNTGLCDKLMDRVRP
jgi:hypothetical protein